MGSDKNFSHSGDPTALLPFISLYSSLAIIWMNGRMDDQMDNQRPQFNLRQKKLPKQTSASLYRATMNNVESKP